MLRSFLWLISVLALAGQSGLAQQISSSSIVTPEALLLEPTKPIERQLNIGETHAFKVVLEAGQFLDAAVNQRAIDVVVRVFSPNGSKIADIDSPNGKQGDEPIAIEAKTPGAYRLEVSSLEKNGSGPAGRYEIRINKILSPTEYAKRLEARKRKQEAVIAELKAHSITIKSVEAESGLADLQPLKHVLKGVRFVGLGEETHGTREFFQFKHRMLEFLVKDMGFRVFALEASYSACQIINDYVLGRMNDGTKALDSQGFWTWNTQEVRAMLDWMRAYNASVPVERRVKFAGFDIQANEPSQTKLLEYLGRVAPERVADTESFFKTDVNELIGISFFGKDDAANTARAKLKELKNQYNDLLVFLEISEPILAAKSSQTEYEQMREYARVLAQYLDVYSRAKPSGALRDTYMADNFRRLVNREPPGTRFVVWAHNQHIIAGGRQPTLGSRLRQNYGDEYYAVGFSFNQGSFQALPRDPHQTGLVSFSVGPAPADSVDWYLAGTKVKIGFVDLRSEAKNKAMADWMSEAHQMRAVGATYDTKNENALVPIVLKQSFDGLFFIDATTRARPNH
jgi:erythromycin esterase